MKKYKPYMILGSLQKHAGRVPVEGGDAARALERPTWVSQDSSSCTKIVGTVWNSKQNGKIYDPTGIAPCITAGTHGGVVPFIIEYEKN